VFDTLAYLAQAYFHQGYELLAPTPCDLVRVFVSKEDPATTNQLRHELDQMIAADASEDEIRAVWMTPPARSSYDPTWHGSTYREWLHQIRDVIGPAS
jgi:hypothetical protein